MRLPLVVAMMLGCGAMSTMMSAGRAAEDDGWISLFNGQDLTGWQTYAGKPVESGWVVEKGALCRKSGGGDIITKDEFDSFELELEWMVTPGGNSGIMYLVRKGDAAPYYSGPEYQVLDDSKHADGKNPKTSAGSLYALVAPEGKSLKPVGEYNSTKIVLKGRHLEHWLNGKQVVDVEMEGPQWKKMVAESKFKDWKQFGEATKGHIALQDHGDVVCFRKIRIRRLKAD